MTSTIFDRLKAPFPPDRISWRVGSTTQDKKKGLAFAYIDARDVMDRLDSVCGPENWQCSYPHANGKTICSIGVRVVREDGSAEWIYKADGAGDSDVEAEKGAMSDAFKRSAVRFGIARYLYDIPATWVAIEAAGKSFKIAEGEYSKLERVLRKPTSQTTPEHKSGAVDEFTARVNFMVDCRDAIAAFTDAAELGAWWNSDDQKSLRRQHKLEEHQVEALKQAVMNRRDALTLKEEAA